MRRRYRAPVAMAATLVVALTLSSCTPAIFVWGYVGEGNDLRLAFCHSRAATMMRLSVSDRDASNHLIEAQSTVWSGPRITLPEGGIVDATALPEGWQKTNDLDLEGSWDRIDVELYDGERYVDFAILDHRDVATEQWSLSPRPSLFAGSTNCARPFEANFAAYDSINPDLASAALAEAKANAMPEDEFWAFLSSVEGPDGTVSLDDLVNKLALLPTVDIGAFHAQLMLQYFELDTARVWKESERQRLDSQAYDTTTAEHFAWLRSAIILGGEESVKAAVVGRSFPVAQAGGALLDLRYVARSAFALAGRDSALPSITLKVGMGQNSDGW